MKTSTGDAYTTYLQDVNVAKDQLDLAVNLVNTQQTVRASYMGLGVEIPGDTLRSQLNLPEGTGLVINWIDDAGPAKGILHQHDVLQKLEDQLLVNGEQLVTLVRLHKPGETIPLTILRESRPLTITLKLAEKDVSPLKSYLRLDTIRQENLDAPNATVLRQQGTLGTIDHYLTQRLAQPIIEPTTQPDRRTLIRRITLDMTGVPPTASEIESFVNDKSPDAYQKLIQRLTSSPAHKEQTPSAWKDVELTNSTQPNGFQLSQISGAADWSSSLVLLNGEALNGEVLTRAARTGPVTIDDGELFMWLQTGPDGNAELTALERATGKNLFKGPIGTPEQWKSVPENVRQKFDSWRQAMQRASHAPATQPATK